MSVRVEVQGFGACPGDRHEWAPADGLQGVLRCSGCGVYGYLRQGAFPFGRGAPVDQEKLRRKIKLYRCSTPGCTRAGVERLAGRGAGARYRWACASHPQPAA